VNSELLRTVYDGSNSWADLLATNGVAARYLLGDRVDNLIARWQPADGIAWYLTDRLGTVRQLVNGSGTAILNSIQYSDFGKILGQTNPSAGDRFAYTGREWETATGLYYYRARFYDADIGRFISQDPIGFAGEDANLYRYVSNRPLQMKDPSGLMAASEDASIKSKSRKKLPPVGICFILMALPGFLWVKLPPVST
jgi:RHS repeat-associated protein